MKKKFLACTLAVLMCLQPASAVLAEDPKPGDVAQTSEKVSISSYSGLSDTAVSDDASSTDEDSSAVSDFSASDTSETISDVDSADSDLSEEGSVQELTEDFSDDAEDTEALTQEESADEDSAQEPEFDDGSVPSAGADANTFGDFQYTISGLTATITKYTGNAASVTVPSKIDNYTVTQIASSTFKDNLSITSVVISDTITEIGSNAFSGCSALKSIKLPSRLKTLGYGFISGTLVTTLTIPAGLTKCNSYNTYNSATSYGPLHGAENLTELILTNGMEKIPDYLAWFSTSETTHLTSVSIPDSVTSIGSFSFANCTALGEITIPDSVTSIADTAFSGWKNLVIKSTAGSAAHAYAKTNNIPFQEVIQEGKRIIAGRLDAVNAEDGTINIEGRDYPVSGNFSLTSAMSILQNSSDKIVVFNYDNSRVTHMEAAEDIVKLQMQAITDVNNSNTFVYENGQYQKTSLSQNMVLKCKVSQNSSYSYDEIRQLLPGYTISVTGIKILASAPLNAHFREALALSKMEFSTPVKVKVTDSKTIATAVFGISSDYIAEKAKGNTEFCTCST